MDENIQKNYALYIQISKSITSQTIHKNLIEIIQILCLPFTKQIKDFENSTFKFLELPFHNPLKGKKKLSDSVVMFSSSSGYYQFHYSLLIIMYYNCEIEFQVDTMGNAHKGVITKETHTSVVTT